MTENKPITPARALRWIHSMADGQEVGAGFAGDVCNILTQAGLLIRSPDGGDNPTTRVQHAFAYGALCDFSAGDCPTCGISESLCDTCGGTGWHVQGCAVVTPSAEPTKVARSVRDDARALIALDAAEQRSTGTAFDMADAALDIANAILTGPEHDARAVPESGAVGVPTFDLYRSDVDGAYVVHVDTPAWMDSDAGPTPLRVYVNDGDAIYARPEYPGDRDSEAGPDELADIASGRATGEDPPVRPIIGKADSGHEVAFAVLERLADDSRALGRSPGIQPDPLRELVSAARYAAFPEPGSELDMALRLRAALEPFAALEV